MKRSKKYIAVLVFATLVYAGLVIGLAMPLLGHRGISEELRLKTTDITRGIVGQPLHLSVEGSGFDDQTCFMLLLDSGNQQAIVYNAETYGDTNAILLNGQTLYLGNRKQATYHYDVSQPDRPRYIKKDSVLGQPTALTIANGVPWVATGFGRVGHGLRTYRLAETITDLATDGDGNVYAAAAIEGLIIFRPSLSGGAPIKLGSLQFSSPAFSVAVAGKLAYVSCATLGLQVCDVSDPTKPRLISTLPWPGSNLKLAIKDHLLLLGSTSQLAIIDIQDPRHPQLLSQLPIATVRDIKFYKNQALLATGAAGLQAIDISDPSHPTPSGHLTPGGFIRCLAVNGNLAYLGTSNAGLLVVDLKKIGAHPHWQPTPIVFPKSRSSASKLLHLYGEGLPESVIAQAEARLSQNCNARDACRIGPVTYLATEEGLMVIDKGASPSIELFQRPLASASVIESAGDTLFIGGSRQTDTAEILKQSIQSNSHGMQIFDLSDLRQPRPRGFLETEDLILKIKVRKNRAYLAIKGKGVFIVDLSDLDHPKVLGTAKLLWPEQNFASYLDFFLSGNVMYIANGRAGLHVFDVSDPSNPQRVSAFNTTEGWVNGLAGDSKQLLTYNFNNDLQRYDITNPQFPRLTGTLDRYSDVIEISINGDVLQLEFTKDNGISRALPLAAAKVRRHGSTEADLWFPAPTFSGDYLLYAFNQQGRKQLPDAIRIDPVQK